MISVVIFTSIRFLPSLTCMSLSHTHCSVKPSLLRPTHRAKRNHPHRRTTIQARHSQAPFHSDPLTTRHSKAPIHSDPLTTRRSQAPIHSDPLTIQARRTRRKSLRSAHDPSSDPLQALDENRSDPLRSAHDPSSNSVDAHGEFSFSVSHSDPLIFLRSTLISLVQSFSISGRQPHFSDP